MSIENKPAFQGMLNIVRFNWPIYVFVCILITILLGINLYSGLSHEIKICIWIFLAAAFLNTVISLLVSHYVYDRSELYKYTWLNKIKFPDGGNFANIHSGFDETSLPLKNKFPASAFTLIDFYNPLYNTEGSIKRAREKYPEPPETKIIDHKNWNLNNASFDVMFCLFAVHEIRSLDEKINFFEQAARHLKKNGKVIMAEHLRDWPNFVAFGYGAFHFASNGHWKKAINSVKSLKITNEFREIWLREK